MPRPTHSIEHKNRHRRRQRGLSCKGHSCLGSPMQSLEVALIVRTVVLPDGQGWIWLLLRPIGPPGALRCTAPTHLLLENATNCVSYCKTRVLPTCNS